MSGVHVLVLTGHVERHPLFAGMVASGGSGWLLGGPRGKQNIWSVHNFQQQVQK